MSSLLKRGAVTTAAERGVRILGKISLMLHSFGFNDVCSAAELDKGRPAALFSLSWNVSGNAFNTH